MIGPVMGESFCLRRGRRTIRLLRKTNVSPSPFFVKKRLLHITVVILALLLTLAGGAFCSADTPGFRFFRSGDGYLHIVNARNGTEVKTRLVRDDGSINRDALGEINRVFGLSGGEAVEHISLRLLFILDHFSDRVAPGRPISLQSGYRSPSYNAKLKDGGGNVASTSTHMDGTAIDFYIDGVDGKGLWEMIRHEACCGVGHYGGRTIHLDAGRPRFWQAATSKTGTGESDFNRKIYLSTDYDRYVAGERMTFSLSSVSTFGFGVDRRVRLVREGQGAVTVEGVLGEEGNGPDCLIIRDRKEARSLSVFLPRPMSPGMYRLAVDFCRIPFSQMPKGVSSHILEVVRNEKDR